VYLKIAGHQVALESADLCRVSEQTWKTSYSNAKHITFFREVGSRYHPRTQSLGSFILKVFAEVEFVNPKNFKDFTHCNLQVVTR
jgi:hypothetical protein